MPDPAPAAAAAAGRADAPAFAAAVGIAAPHFEGRPSGPFAAIVDCACGEMEVVAGATCDDDDDNGEEEEDDDEAAVPAVPETGSATFVPLEPELTFEGGVCHRETRPRAAEEVWPTESDSDVGSPSLRG